MAPAKPVVVTAKHADLIARLLASLAGEGRETCQAITDYLLGLGYLPRKQPVRGYVLSFHSPRTRQTIAKIAAPAEEQAGAAFSLKFYACRQPPLKYVDAVQAAFDSSHMQYLCGGCGVCGAAEGGRGYRCTGPDRGERVRCGAYVVRIPDLGPADVADVERLLLEQHTYFVSRME